MAQRTLTRMYDNYEDAKAVVNDLEAAGIPHSDISLVANADAHGRASGRSSTDRDTTSTGAGSGAVLGTVLGGGAGLLAGIGALAIPGIGPVVAAGWLVATLAGAGVGAASGGLIGSLTGAGVSQDEAHVYAQGIKDGSSLVTVRVDDAEATRVEAVLAQRSPVDWQQRRASYGTDWKGFDASSSGNVSDAGSVTPSGSLPKTATTAAPGSIPSGRV